MSSISIKRLLIKTLNNFLIKKMNKKPSILVALLLKNIPKIFNLFLLINKNIKVIIIQVEYQKMFLYQDNQEKELYNNKKKISMMIIIMKILKK